MDQKTPRTLYVVTFNWRDCDPFISVAGFDFSAVDAKACELAKDELEEAVDQELVNDDDSNEEDVRSRLESDLCSTGVCRFEYPAHIDDLGLDAEHVHELEQDGIAVY